MGGTGREESEEAALGSTKSILPGTERSGRMSPPVHRSSASEDLHGTTRRPAASSGWPVRNAIRPSEQPPETGQTSKHFPCRKYTCACTCM